MTMLNRKLEKKRCLSSGFTLLEMLLALSIFTLVSFAAWQILSTVSTAQKVQSDNARRLYALDYAFLHLKKDLRQLVDRGEKGREGGERYSTFLRAEPGTGNTSLSFVRTGWRNNDQRLPRSSLQRVYYRLNGDTLERGYDRLLDTPGNTGPEYRPLLPGVKKVKFRFFTNGQWQDNLRESAFPEGIAISLDFVRGGSVERRFNIVKPWKGLNGT